VGSIIIGMSHYFWAISLLAVASTLFVQVDASGRFSAVLWVIMGLAMDRIALYWPALSTWHPEFAAASWYLIWCIFNTATVILIVYYHRANDLKAATLTKYIALSCMAMVFLQALRLLDRLVAQTNLLESIYRFGVPAINIAVIGAIVIWTWQQWRQAKC